MFGFKGKSPDLRQLGKDIGATHIIEGSIQKAATMLRINVQLIETSGGSHLWAQRYDRELKDLFQIQDDIVGSIATELDVQLVSGEQARRYRLMSKNAEAYDLYLQVHSLWNVFSPETLHRANELLDKAIQLDPQFPVLYANKAILLLELADNNWTPDPEAAKLQAKELAEKLSHLDSVTAHLVNGMIFRRDGRFEEAKAELELSRAAIPNMPIVHVGLGYLYLRTGDYQNALSESRLAKKLSPSAVTNNIELELLALQLLGRCEEAYAVARQNSRNRDNDLFFLTTYAGIAFHLKLLDESRSICTKILEIKPNFDAEGYATRTAIFGAGARENYIELLRAMGLP